MEFDNAAATDTTTTATESSSYTEPSVTDTDTSYTETAAYEAPTESSEPVGTTDPAPSSGFDPSILPPEVAPVWQEYEQFKTQYAPDVEWLTQAGGRQALESDLNVLSAAFADDPAVRDEQFHQALFEASPQAYKRLLEDFISAPYVEEQILGKYGLSVDERGQVLVNGEPLQAGTVSTSALSESAQEVLGTLTPELQEVFQSLDPEIQEDLALQSQKVREFNLRNYETTYRLEKAQREQYQREQQRIQHERRQQQVQREQQVYNDVRNTIKQSLQAAFPEESDLNLVLAAAEQEFFTSVEGDAGWSELNELLARGEMRAVKSKLPGLIAKAQSIASKHASSYSQKLEQARLAQGLLQTFGQDGVNEVKAMLSLLAKGEMEGVQTHLQRLAMQARNQQRREPGSGNFAPNTRNPLPSPPGEGGSYALERMVRHYQAALSR